MYNMTDAELVNIKGGSITGTFLNAVTRMFSTLLEVGRSIGSAILRYRSKNYCI